MFPLFDDNPHRRVPWITLALILANLLTFIWQVRLPGPQSRRVVARWGFVPQRVEQLSNPRLVVDVNLTPPEVEALPPAQRAAHEEVIRLPAQATQFAATLVTTTFLHGGWMHLIGNMWFLWIFGNNVEDRLGHPVYLGFYLLGGVLASTCHWLSDPASAMPVIGASGAVAAVLGAYAITFPTAKVRTLIFLIVIIRIIDLPALVVLGFWFVVQLVSGLVTLNGGADVGGGVAWWAHVGGFAAGMILMPILSLGAPRPEHDWVAEAEEQFGPIHDPPQR